MNSIITEPVKRSRGRPPKTKPALPNQTNPDTEESQLVENTITDNTADNTVEDSDGEINYDDENEVPVITQIKEVKEEVPDNNGNLPSINEELAQIFPESADVFLKETKRKRGRPSKGTPPKQKIPGRGRGRPRKNPEDPKHYIKKLHIPGRGRGRPRKYPTEALKSYKNESLNNSVRKVGRPKLNPEEREAMSGQKMKRSLDPGLEAMSGQKMKRSLDPGLVDADFNLRKRQRLSYVDTDSDLDLLDEESDSDYNQTADGMDSGFESVEPVTEVKRGRGRPRLYPIKVKKVFRKRGRPRKTDMLLNMTVSVSLERLNSSNHDLMASRTVTVIHTPQAIDQDNSYEDTHVQVPAKKRGRPPLNKSNCSKSKLGGPLVTASTSGRKRGRPPGSKKKQVVVDQNGVEDNKPETSSQKVDPETSSQDEEIKQKPNTMSGAVCIYW